MRQQNENHEKRRVYYYGFQIIIGAIVKVTLLAILAAILGVFTTTFVAIAAFATLRSFAGGYHMNTYGKCFITSAVLFLAAGFMAEYIHPFITIPWMIFLNICIAVFFGITIFLWIPGDTPNKPITKDSEIKKFKVLSIIYLILWVVTSCILHIMGWHIKLNFAFSLGVLFELFTVTPKGYEWFEKISGKADQLHIKDNVKTC